MDAGILLKLRDLMNSATQPNAPYQIGPGIGWSVILPRESFATDLHATLSSSNLRTWVGVITPSGSTNTGTARQPYGPGQPRGGARREMTVYMTIFLRSLKAIAYDGAVLALEDLMQELVGDFSAKDHPKVYAASVQSMEIMSIPPDFLAFEFNVTLSYSTMSRDDAGIILKQIGLGGNLFDFIDQVTPPLP
jgi:hypothetical protein